MHNNIKVNKYLLLTIIMFIIIAHQLVFYNATYDDSYVSYRYANNWVDGYGLVFNQGERVEGYSNFLWVIILGIFHKIGFGMEFLGKTLSIIFSSLTIYAVFRLTRLFNKSQPITYVDFIAPVYLCISPLYIYWCSTGMETAMFSLLIILACYFYLKEKEKNMFPVSGIILILLAMSRPEAILFAILLLAYETIYFVINKKAVNKILIKQSLKRYFICFTGFGIFLFWRYSYYGYILPNTYYSKRGGETLMYYLKIGFDYWKSFIFNNAPGGGNGLVLYLIIPVLLSIILLKRRKYKESWFNIIFLFLLGYSLYIIAAGGDVIEWFRFYALLLPLFFLFVQEGLRETAKLEYLKSKYLNLLVILIVLITSFQSLFFWKNKIYTAAILKGEHYAAMKKLGTWFKEHTTKNTVFACADMGVLSWYSERRVIDYFGLADKFIAHTVGKHYGRDSKEVVEYLLNCKPDYMILVNKLYPPNGLFAGNYCIDIALFNNEVFKKNYAIFTSYEGGLPYYFESSPYYYLVLFKRVN